MPGTSQCTPGEMADAKQEECHLISYTFKWEE